MFINHENAAARTSPSVSAELTQSDVGFISGFESRDKVARNVVAPTAADCPCVFSDVAAGKGTAIVINHGCILLHTKDLGPTFVDAMCWIMRNAPEQESTIVIPEVNHFDTRLPNLCFKMALLRWQRILTSCVSPTLFHLGITRSMPHTT